MEPPLCLKQKPLCWVTLKLTLKLTSNLTLNLTLNHPMSQNSWRSKSRCSLQSELLLLQPPFCLLILNEAPSLLRRDTFGATQWVTAYPEKNYRVLKLWREFWSLLQHPCDSTIKKTDPPASCSLLDSHCIAREGWVVDCPTLSDSIGVEEIPSSKRFPGEPWLSRSKGRKRQLPLPWPSRAVLCYLDCPQEWYLEWCRSSANVLPPSLRMMVSWTWRCYMLWKRTLWLLLLYLLPHSPPPDPEKEEQVIPIPKESCAQEPEEAAHSEGWLDLVRVGILPDHGDLSTCRQIKPMQV